MPYKVLGMLYSGGLGKDMHSGVRVPYMSARERAKYEITTHGGLLKTAAGANFDTRSASNGVFIFVMTAEGTIYSANKLRVTHHSSFLSGNPVAAAGHMQVVNGALQMINSQSGHYQPTSDYMLQFLSELKKRGVSLKGVKMHLGTSSKQASAYYKRLAHYSWWRGGTVIDHFASGVRDSRGNAVKTGQHIQGQRMRLYPGSKPQCGWI